MIMAGLSGQITSTLTGDFRFGWLRNRTATDRSDPTRQPALLALPGTETGISAGQAYMALDPGGRGGAQSLLSEPIDVDTQLARKQANDNKNLQWNADLNWVKRNHTFQFGGHIRYLPTLHLRDDKVVGALGALVAQIDSDLGSSSSRRLPVHPLAVQTLRGIVCSRATCRRGIVSSPRRPASLTMSACWLCATAVSIRCRSASCSKRIRSSGRRNSTFRMSGGFARR